MAGTMRNTVLAGLHAVWSLAAVAGEVSWKPPAAYEELLKPRLTPLAAAIEAGKGIVPGDAGGVIVLDERFFRVDDGANQLVAIHLAKRATTQAGAESLARMVYSYERDDVQIHVAMARTIAPDGTERSADPSATFVQSPQYEASESLYTDTQELVIVFPRSEVGSVTEVVLVLEEKPRVAGRLSIASYLGWGWPVATIRRQIDAPDALVPSLKIHAIGSHLKETRAVRDGRTVIDWMGSDPDGITYEARMPSMLQTGPVLRITSIASWDEIALWYDALLADRGSLDPALAADVDGWTAGLKEPREIVAALESKVANDVRYTGLEFGVAGYQPAAPDEVWRNRYGDCKDKANLLRAMLAHKGISSFVTLVQSYHAGSFDRDIPDYRSFDHAILAVDLGGNGGSTPASYFWCDPTASFLPAGELPPSDTGRDLMIVKGKSHEIARVPQGSMGSFWVDLDLKLDPDGDLSGWLSLSGDHAYGAWIVDTYRKLDRPSLLDLGREVVNGFFENADVIDVDAASVAADPPAPKVRMFFRLAAAHQDGEERQLRFPHGGMVFPDLGDTRARRTTYHQDLESTHLRVSYALPAGFRPGALPAPYKASGPVEAIASWKSQGSSLVADLDYRTLETDIDPRRYAVFAQTVASLSAWMDAPLAVRPQASAGDDVRHDAQAVEMTQMPTGKGQLRLIDSMFPDGSDTARERQALRQARQWFPRDDATVFEVGVRLASLDDDEGHPAEAVQQIDTLLAQYSGKVDKELRSWAEYLRALCLGGSGKTADAVLVLTRLGKDVELSAYRRGWSYAEAARLLLSTDVEKASGLADEGLAIDSRALPTILSYKIEVLRKRDALAGLGALIDDVLARFPSQAEAVGAELAELATFHSDNGRPDVAALLVKEVEARPALGSPESIATTHQALDARTGWVAIQKKIREDLTASPSAYLQGTTFDEKLDRKTLEEKISTLGEGEDVPAYVRHEIELLTRFEPDPNAFEDTLWRLLATLVSHAPSSDLIERAVGWCAMLPHGTQAYGEARLHYGNWLRGRGEPGKALEVATELAGDATASEQMRAVAVVHRGFALEALGRADEALAAYGSGEGMQKTLIASYDGLHRAFYLQIEAGRYDAALALAKVIRDADEDMKKKMSSSDLVPMVVRSLDEPETLRGWWSNAWWKSWLAVEKSLDLPAAPPLPRKIVLAELGARLRDEAAANHPKEFFEDYRLLARIARFHPEEAVDLSFFTDAASRLRPDLVKQLRGLAIEAQLAVVSRDPSIVKKSLINVMAQYVDMGSPEKVPDIAAEYAKRFPDKDDLSIAVHRVAGLAAIALQKGREELVTALQSDLERGPTSRAQTVNVLAQLLEALGRTDDLRTLLTAEVADSRTQSNAPVHKDLKARLHALETSRTEAQGLDETLDAWLAAHRPGWFDFARPEKIEPKHLEELDEIVDGKSDLLRVERCKVLMLVAGDKSQTAERRLGALHALATQLGELGPFAGESARLRADLALHSSLAPETRKAYARVAIAQAIIAEDESYVRELLGAKDLPEVSEELRKSAALALAAFDPTLDAKRVGEGVDRSLQGSMDWLRLHAFMLGYRRLVALGAFDDAERALDKLPSANLEDGPRGSIKGLSLEAHQDLVKAKRLHPSMEAMRRVILDRQGKLVDKLPKAARIPDGNDGWDLLSRGSAVRLRLEMVRDHRVEPGDWDFWAELCREIRDESGDVALALDALAAGLAASTDDGDQAEMLKPWLSWVDYDEPDEMARFAKVIAPYRGVDHPECARVAHLIDLTEAIHLDDSPDIDATAAAAAKVFDRNFASRLRIAYFLRNGDKARLRKEIESLDSDALLEAWGIPLRIRALDALGMDREASTLRKEAEEQFYRAILASWAGGSVSSARRAMRLLTVLPEKKLPEGWLAACLSHIDNERNKTETALHGAWVVKDWPKVVELATKMLEVAPREHGWTFYLGKALWELGRKEEAVPHLERFVKRAKDDEFYPEAVAMLASAHP